MFRKNPMLRIVWWSVFTLIADLSALRQLYIGQIDGISIIAATMMSLGLIYLIASYKIDGPGGMKLEIGDERIRSISNKARSNGFYFLFFCTWFLAFLINVPGLSFLQQNINVVFAATAMTGLLIMLLSFAWYKYRLG